MKLTKILMLTFCIITLLTNVIYAGAIGTIIDQSEGWITDSQDKIKQTMDTSLLIDVSSDLYNIFLIAAIAVAMIVGGILGVQYMTAGIDEKVKVKESLFPYIVSCIVVFGSFGIWKFVVTIMKGF